MSRTGVRVSAIIFRDNKVLLIYRRKPGREYWVFPGGGVEDSETTEETLIREVKEETNLDVINYTFAFSVKFEDTSDVEQPFFYCDVSEGTPEIVGEEREINCEDNYYRLEWVKISELKHINLFPESAKELIIRK